MFIGCILLTKQILKCKIMKRAFLILVMLQTPFGIVLATDEREITGFVTNENSRPIPGVSVVIEHATRGTTSDKNGFYRIEVGRNDKVLVFSFVGMETRKVKIGKKTRIDVELKTGNDPLNEIVVAGSAIKRERVVSPVKSARYCVVGGVTPINWNTENYSTIHENGFRNVRANPLSTFSIDVDNASYSNLRRYINQGEMPPVDAIRVEEMINYFHYDYPEPDGNHPFSITTELARCPWNADNYLLHIGLQGRRIDKGNLPPSNLVLLLDVSGSMGMPNKLPLLKRAFKMLVNELRPTDHVAIVVYAGAAGKVLDATPGNKKRKIIEALENLSAGGSTAGGEGLKLAYKIAGDNFIEGGNNRIILATDGDFNVGVSSTSEMERLIEREREKGVFITVMGFGMGNIKDDKMEAIADKGNGNYAYIDNIREARKVFITEFGGTLFTIAKDVKFQLEFNPEQVKAYRLVGYENRLLNAEDFNDDKKDAGEMGAGHTVTALYEIVPVGSMNTAPSVDPLKYQKPQPVTNKHAKELLTIKLRYKQPDGNRSKLLELPVKNKLEKTTSDNFRFSAAVASFGMLMRGSGFMGNTTIESVLSLGKNAKGSDEEGYRSEFIQLVKTAGDLKLFAEK